MPSHPKHFGYLMIDHRASPGLPDVPGLGPGSVFEADTVTCNHCHVPVVLNPFRKRERFRCPKCNEYCCDICAVGYQANGICKPFECIAEEVMSGETPLPLLAKDMKG
jgi:hypothetical protein